MPERRPEVVVVGAGPAGLMAAETLAPHARVVVLDRMPSPGRKLLMAGRGGLNLTHSEPAEPFLARYNEARSWLEPVIAGFDAASLRNWVEALGQPCFTGSSGRVFPRAMKASPLLRAWLARLEAQGVGLRLRTRLLGFDGDALRVEGPDGERVLRSDATILAMGGASWPRLGSDGAWTAALAAAGVPLAPFAPANCGFVCPWSTQFVDRFAGTPIKNVRLSLNVPSPDAPLHDARLSDAPPLDALLSDAVPSGVPPSGVPSSGVLVSRGDLVLTSAGIEGGAVYPLSARLRDRLATGPAVVLLDLRPDLSEAALGDRLARIRGRESLSNTLRKALSLSPASIALLRETGSLPDRTPAVLAGRIKAVPIPVLAATGLDRAISTAGGIRQSGFNRDLMLRARPGTFCCGEMLDWEAPTGGYLLQAAFATGRAAGQGALRWLGSAG